MSRIQRFLRDFTVAFISGLLIGNAAMAATWSGWNVLGNGPRNNTVEVQTLSATDTGQQDLVPGTAGVNNLGTPALPWQTVNSSYSLTQGSVKLGNDLTTPSVFPSTLTVSNWGFSIMVPFVNVSGSTMTQGQLVVAPTTTTQLMATAGSSLGMMGTFVNATATNTWIGFCNQSLAQGATGYMVVAGYALALASGTVSIGSEMASLSTSGQGGVGGYVGAVTPGVGVASDTVVGIAMTKTPVSNAEGLVIVRIR